MRYLRLCFGALCGVAPHVAARFALHLFLTPRPQAAAAWEEPLRQTALPLVIPFGSGFLAALAWGSGPTVLLTHGWGGHGTQLGLFVEPLVEAGFRVIALDGPAHGFSSGTRTDLIEYAAAIREVCARQSVVAIVGHSFGAGCTLVALRLYGLDIRRAVLLSGPSSAAWMIDVFASYLNIASPVADRMRSLLERRYHHTWTWSQFDIVRMAPQISIPLLVAHDEGDTTVPYAHAIAMKTALSDVTLVSTSGNGHRNTVLDETIIARSVAFLEPLLDTHS